MKKIIIKYTLLLTLAVLLIACPSTADDGSSSSNSDNSNNSGDTTTKLYYVETITNGETSGGKTIEGLNGQNVTSISPDGSHVYAVGDAVAIFTRDKDTGKLTYESKFTSTDIQVPESVMVSPNGAHVYVTAYTTSSIVTVTRDSSAGSLSNAVAITKTTVANLAGANRVTISPDGKNVYVTGWTANAVVWFTRNKTSGALTAPSSIKNGDTSGGNTVSGLDGPSSITVSPDGDNVYVTALNKDAVLVFSRDTTTGALTFLEVLKKTGTASASVKIVPVGVDSPYALSISPDNKFVYVAVANDNAIAIFTRDTTDTTNKGKLTYSNIITDNDISNGKRLTGLTAVHAVAVSPDNKYVYTAEPGGTFLIFTRNTSTGALTFDQEFLDEGTNAISALQGAKSITASSDNKHVYLGSQVAKSLIVFERR